MKKTVTISLYVGIFLLFTNALTAQKWVAVENSRGLLPAGYFATAMKVVDSLTIWIVAYRGGGPGIPAAQLNAKVVKTVNGGQTWRVIDIPDLQGSQAFDIQAVDTSTAWLITTSIATFSGSVYKTTNGGNTWQKKMSTTNRGVLIRFFDRNTGVAIGEKFSSTTTDGGETWITNTTPLTIDPSEYFSAGISATNNCVTKGDTIWFGSDVGRTFRSTNKGLTWQPINTGIPVAWNNIESIAFKDAKNGLLSGDDYDTGYGFKGIAKTSDGGTTWQPLTTLPTGASALFSPILANIPNSNAYILAGAADTIGAAVSTLGKSFLTRDNGATWIPFTTNAYGTGPMEFLSPRLGWMLFGDMTRGSDILLYRWDAGNLFSPTAELSQNITPLSISPNPAHKTLNIQVEMTEQTSRLLTITDLLGKTVLSKKVDLTNGLNQLTLDLPPLASGVYMLSVGGATQRLMIQ